MDANDLLVDAFERVRELVHSFGDLDAAVLDRQPARGSNSIGWLIWHTTRVQDAQVADLLDRDQLWVSDGTAQRLGFAPDPADTGYGHSEGEAASVHVGDIEALLAHHDAVAARTIDYVRGLGHDDLDRIVDTSYDPPVTVGVRLVSVVSDSLQHLGQAAYARGLLGA